MGSVGVLMVCRGGMSSVYCLLGAAWRDEQSILLLRSSLLFAPCVSFTFRPEKPYVINLPFYSCSLLTFEDNQE